MPDLTDAQLDYLGELLADATPPPWRPARSGIDAGDCGYDTVLAPGPVDCMRYCYGGTSTIDGERLPNDLHLATAAVNSLHDLIAEVRRLRAAVAAFDDMPQPIGYAVVVDTGNGHATAIPTISQDLRMAEAIAAEVIGTAGVRALIVTITAVRRTL